MMQRDKIEGILRRRGLRVTPQRVAIMSFLHGNTDHPTADEIYETVSEIQPSISLNTVYKTLESFEEANLVWRFAVGQKQKFHYDPNTEIHPHLTCSRCGRVDDLPDDDDEIQQKVEKLLLEPQYQVMRIEINAIGICRQCREG